MSRTFLILFLMVLLVGVASPALATNAPTIELETAVHFLTPGGEDVRLEAGTYEVEATDTGLKLLPEGGARTDIILLEAIVGDHEEILETPVVRYKPAEDQEDVIHLALLLPDGTGHEAVGSYSGIRPRGFGSVLAYLQSRQFSRSPKKPSSRPPRLAPPVNPVDCGPYIKDLGRKFHYGPALAVYQGKMHLVTVFFPPVPNSFLHRTLRHSIYANGKWSKPKQIKGQYSKTGVALATFGNRLHMVHLGRSSTKLYHATYDGRKWSKKTKITAQKSKATPILGVFQNRLYMVHKDHKSDDLWFALYDTRGGWKARKKILRGNVSDNRILQIKRALGGFFTGSPRTLSLFAQGRGNLVSFQKYILELKKNGEILRARAVNSPSRGGGGKIKSIAAFSLREKIIKGQPPDVSEFAMYVDDSKRLHWVQGPMWLGNGFARFKPFLHEKSQFRPALAQPQRCIHAVYVHHPSGKLRHVKFDVDSLQ